MTPSEQDPSTPPEDREIPVSVESVFILVLLPLLSWFIGRRLAGYVLCFIAAVVTSFACLHRRKAPAVIFWTLLLIAAVSLFFAHRFLTHEQAQLP